jgi:hypothetical protein
MITGILGRRSTIGGALNLPAKVDRDEIEYGG